MLKDVGILYCLEYRVLQGHLRTQSLVSSKMMTRVLGGSTVTGAPDTRARLEINCFTPLSQIASFTISTLWQCLVSPVLNVRRTEEDR